MCSVYKKNNLTVWRMKQYIVTEKMTDTVAPSTEQPEIQPTANVTPAPAKKRNNRSNRKQRQKRKEEKTDDETNPQPATDDEKKPQPTTDDEQNPSTVAETVAEEHDSNQMISIAQLKAKCKELGIKGYSKKMKNQIVDMLVEHYPEDDEIQKIALIVQNVKNLKQICKQLRIKGYSAQNKQEIVDAIYSKRKQQQEMDKQLNELFENNDYNCVSTTFIRNVIVKCFESLSENDKELTLQTLLNRIESQEKNLEKVISKCICKMIKTT